MKPYAPFAAMALALALSSCQKNEFAPPPPPVVTVENPSQEDTLLHLKFTGKTEAKQTMNIRARVQGYLEEVYFDDGQIIKKGEKLYKIEQAPFEAQVKAAEANVSKAVEDHKLAVTEYKRLAKAAQANAVSEIDVEMAAAQVEVAKALIQVAESELTQRQLDLSYTAITAPVDGKISRTMYFPGDLVGTSSTANLTTLVSQNPIHVFFFVDERTILGVRTNNEKSDHEHSRGDTPPVELELADGSLYPIQGEIDFIGESLESSTGTLRVRAVFENPNADLIPSMFVRVRLPITAEKAIRVPEVSVRRDLTGSYVMVVNEKGQVEQRKVELGPLVGTLRMIKEGEDGTVALTTDDKVITVGVQRARPGMVVTAEMAASQTNTAGMKEADAPAAEPQQTETSEATKALEAGDSVETADPEAEAPEASDAE